VPGVDWVFKRSMGISDHVIVPMPVDEAFRAVTDFEGWGGWLVRIAPAVISEGPVGVGTVVDIPLENFWGTPAGLGTAFASLSRTGYGRAYGKMEVTEFIRGARLTLTSQPAPMRLRVRLTTRPVPDGTELVYSEEVLEFGRLLGAIGLLVLPIPVSFLVLLLPFKPVFRWALRRRLRRVASGAAHNGVPAI